jgi:hypothetical protein
MGPSRHLLGSVDAGRGIKFQALNRLLVAPHHGLVRGAQLGPDAVALAYIPAPAGKDEAGARSNEKKNLRHG